MMEKYVRMQLFLGICGMHKHGANEELQYSKSKSLDLSSFNGCIIIFIVFQQASVSLIFINLENIMLVPYVVLSAQIVCRQGRCLYFASDCNFHCNIYIDIFEVSLF